jgi:hypothetical protein
MGFLQELDAGARQRKLEFLVIGGLAVNVQVWHVGNV